MVPPKRVFPPNLFKGGMTMRRIVGILIVMFLIFLVAIPSFAVVYAYSFPKAKAEWGKAVSFNNLSPGFFQIMYIDDLGIVRIATYGIAGGSMDTLKNPQLMMVFTFDKATQAVSSTNCKALLKGSSYYV